MRDDPNFHGREYFSPPKPVDEGDRELGALRILVVEDDVIVGDDLGETVEEIGYRLAGVVYTVDDALAFLDGAEQLPNCVLLDVCLGRQVPTAIVDYLDRSSIPYVFVTGMDRSSLSAAGFDGIIVGKPYCSRDLNNAIASAIHSSVDTRGALAFAS